VKWLSGRGAAAALAVGLTTIWGFGWRGFVLLLAFFVSSSLLSEKTSRNERQVIANGGVAALAALAGSWTAFAGALAAATADTWASEIGRHSRTPPRLITTGQPVPAGTDGGMTVLGTAGGVVGAGCVAALSVLLRQAMGPGSAHPRSFWAVIAIAGGLGMVLDSLLGATLQGKTRWLDNDAVNLLATLAGAAMATAGAALHA
jgi:uncharacterized protein (TIGR00297 family)